MSHGNERRPSGNSITGITIDEMHAHTPRGWSVDASGSGLDSGQIIALTFDLDDLTLPSVPGFDVDLVLTEFGIWNGGGENTSRTVTPTYIVDGVSTTDYIIDDKGYFLSLSPSTVTTLVHGTRVGWTRGDTGYDISLKSITLDLAYTESAAVPEPSTFALAGLGLLGLIGWAMAKALRRRA